MTINTTQRAAEILADIEQINYTPAAMPREQRLGEIKSAVDSCIQAFTLAGASPECLAQLELMKGKC